MPIPYEELLADCGRLRRRAETAEAKCVELEREDVVAASLHTEAVERAKQQQARAATAERELAEMKATAAIMGPAYKSAQQRIGALEADLADARRVIEAVRDEIDAALGQTAISGGYARVLCFRSEAVSGDLAKQAADELTATLSAVRALLVSPTTEET